MATIVVPHLLMRFITPPLQSSRVYDSKKPSYLSRMKNLTTLILSFPILELVERKNREALGRFYTPQIIDWRPQDAYCSSSSNSTGVIGCKPLDLVEESRILWREGKKSPFFSRFFKSGCHSQKTIQSQCDAVWMSQLQNKDDPLTGGAGLEDEDDNDYETVPFVVIVRINNKLDVYKCWQ
jgi:hypothetical protein